MAWQLTRDSIFELVKTALKSVADFNDDDPSIEDYTFEHFHGFHQVLFLHALKKEFIGKEWSTVRNGKTLLYIYDVPLNEGMVANWASFGDCIGWLEENQQIQPVEPKVQLS